MGNDVLSLLILFENQIQTTSASPYRTQVQLAASFLVCSLIFIEYYMFDAKTSKSLRVLL
ncbi:extracellular solute-binding protein [Streptococcus pneumoniae]|nr:extracellular solute-binding protein [Streptococcus pneumoniae]